LNADAGLKSTIGGGILKRPAATDPSTLPLNDYETSFSDGTEVTVDFDCGRISVFKKRGMT
jgi:hypothetical protein